MLQTLYQKGIPRAHYQLELIYGLTDEPRSMKQCKLILKMKFKLSHNN
jgi:hypothetical protein